MPYDFSNVPSMQIIQVIISYSACNVKVIFQKSDCLVSIAKNIDILYNLCALFWSQRKFVTTIQKYSLFTAESSQKFWRRISRDKFRHTSNVRFFVIS